MKKNAFLLLLMLSSCMSSSDKVVYVVKLEDIIGFWFGVIFIVGLLIWSGFKWAKGDFDRK